MSYKKNPKTSGIPSGIVCCIPQPGEFGDGLCPNKCDDCFFQGGRSYLEPLTENLPNMPEDIKFHQVVRVNDGHDSNIMPKGMDIREATKQFPMKFYNTALPRNLDWFDAPVVLTLNPGKLTDTEFWEVPEAEFNNLMYVRFRTNTWNLKIADDAIEYYTSKEVPVVLTFMAYFHTIDHIPENHRKFYMERKRTSNVYTAITTEAWRDVMMRYEDNKWVDSCSKIEGELGTSACRFCGVCLKHYHAAMEKELCAN